MENTFGIGTLVVDDRGSLILLLQDGIQTGEFKNGVLPRFYEGVILPNLTRWRGLIVRPVGHISDLVKILSQTVDINTPRVAPSVRAEVNTFSYLKGVFARVARKLNVSPSMVSKVASGNRFSPKIQAALREELEAIKQKLDSIFCEG